MMQPRMQNMQRGNFLMKLLKFTDYMGNFTVS